MSLKLGALPDPAEAKLGRRDAFHAPAVLVESTSSLEPGQKVRFVIGNSKLVKPLLPSLSVPGAQIDGIVDPFLEAAVPAGQPFWMLVLPSLVSDLTHNFDIANVGDSRVTDKYREFADMDPHDQDCRIEGC